MRVVDYSEFLGMSELSQPFCCGHSMAILGKRDWSDDIEKVLYECGECHKRGVLTKQKEKGPYFSK